MRDPSGDMATVGPAANGAGALADKSSVKRTTGRPGGPGRGRNETQSARLAASAATAHGVTPRVTDRRSGDPGTSAVVPGRASASTNSAAVWNRSAGTFASACITAASTCGGTD